MRDGAVPWIPGQTRRIELQCVPERIAGNDDERGKLTHGNNRQVWGAGDVVRRCRQSEWKGFRV
jgi:hypothetical protein